MANNTRQHSEQYSFLQTCREQFASTAILARDIQNERSSLRRSSSTNTNFNGADIMNSDSNGVTKDFVVGIDYGTTFTSVSYFVYSNADGTRHAKISDVKTIKNWPDDPTCGSAEQVPTETWYSKIPLQRSPLVDQYDDPASSLQLQDGTLEAVPSQDENVDPNDIEENDGMDTDESTEFLWGYTVHYQMYIARTTRNLNRHIPRPKLMLVNTSYTQKDRLVLRHQLNQLIKKGLIRKYGKRHEPDDRDVRDVIADFLIKVFQHTKEQLVEYEGLRDHCKVDFVITVPTIWSQESSRVLQVCVEDAIRATGFGRLTNESISNLFIIPEPEAAATFLLGNSHAMLVSFGRPHIYACSRLTCFLKARTDCHHHGLRRWHGRRGYLQHRH
jgi:hypothetical protein